MAAISHHHVRDGADEADQHGPSDRRPESGHVKPFDQDGDHVQQEGIDHDHEQAERYDDKGSRKQIQERPDHGFRIANTSTPTTPAANESMVTPE